VKRLPRKNYNFKEAKLSQILVVVQILRFGQKGFNSTDFLILLCCRFGPRD
jgi:hypothetical protein